MTNSLYFVTGLILGLVISWLFARREVNERENWFISGMFAGKGFVPPRRGPMRSTKAPEEVPVAGVPDEDQTPIADDIPGEDPIDNRPAGA